MSWAGLNSMLIRIWPHAYTVCVVYAVTLSIFPG